MMQYSLLDRRPEEHCLSLLRDNEISVLARGSLAQGLLINKPAKDYLGHSAEEVKLVQKTIRSSSQRAPFETAIQFSLYHPAVASVVVGIRNEAQLREAVKAMEREPLTETEYKQVSELIPAGKYEQHR
jgi:aryl-alcohol dehydrogenase-like predicted oxidoreductase